MYDLSSETEKKFIIISTANKPIDSKKVADIIAQKYGYNEKIDGYFKGEWIIFDFSSVVLHIFLPKIREKYNLDKLYKSSRLLLVD